MGGEELEHGGEPADALGVLRDGRHHSPAIWASSAISSARTSSGPTHADPAPQQVDPAAEGRSVGDPVDELGRAVAWPLLLRVRRASGVRRRTCSSGARRVTSTGGSTSQLIGWIDWCGATGGRVAVSGSVRGHVLHPGDDERLDRVVAVLATAEVPRSCSAPVATAGARRAALPL